MLSPPAASSHAESRPLPDEQLFRRLLYRPVWALTVALAVPGLVLLGLVVALLRSAAWVDHTDRVIAEAHTAERLLLMMQTDFRAYRLSGDADYAEQVGIKAKQAAARLAALQQTVQDNSRQGAAIGGIEDRTQAWVNFASGEIEQVRTGRTELRDTAFLRQGVPLFNAVLERLDAFVAEENRLRELRTAKLTRVISALFVTLGLALVAGIPALALWLYRSLRHTSQTYEASVDAAERNAAGLRVTLSSIGDAVVATDAQGRVDFLNPAAEALMGWPAAEARGRELAEVFVIFNEKTGAPAENPVDRVLRENVVVGLANHTVLRARSGRELPIEDSAAPIRNERGEVAGVILVFHDVSEKRETQRRLEASEHRLRFLNELGDATRALVDPVAIMASSARLLGEHLGVSRCAYADVGPDSDRFTILHDFTDGCASSVGDYQLSLFGPVAVARMRAGQTLVVREVEAELAPGEGAEMFNAIGVKAIICCPLVKEGALRAMMAVHQTTPRAWTEVEVALVEEVVERCWATIERARAESEAHVRAQLAALRADIVQQFDLGEGLERTLQNCCELLVRHLGAAFARVWTLDPGASVLVLRASAGLYTHLDGPHARVPVGEFKIGRIAQTLVPHLTNTVATDPNISDPDWARREGMTAFAGYPLLVEGDVLGVLALFSRHVLPPAVLSDLKPISDAVAQHMRRKRAEAALQRATEEARAGALAAAESAERFRLLADVVSLQVWTANLAGELDYVNQQCQVYLGGDPERDILGHHWVGSVHPEDLPGATERWQHSLATGDRYEVEFRLRSQAGDYRWFLARAAAMRDEGGQMKKWFGTNTDIHALKLAQSDAERASRAKDSFLAALSHELRTPLTPVLMTAAALREDVRLPIDVRDQLGMMERNIALEARLIDDLLDLTSIARGKLHLRSQPCDAHSLIGLAVEIVRDDAAAKGIVLEREFAAARSGLMADPARFQQVIWNLLRNAVKFTPRGGRITIRTRDDDGGRLRIEVIDSGIGIAAGEIEKIFLPFEQSVITGDHRFGGMGLGLAIARTIVGLHGGTIAAESAGPNRGSTFVVEFPNAIDPPHGVAESMQTSARFPASGIRSTSLAERERASRRLLLVEDHEPTLRVLLKLFTRAGHQVVTAGTVTEALSAAAACTFDLVISDLGLPDGTGIELMEKLRDGYGLRGIALSGYGMEEDLARSLEAGFITHLTKPVDFSQLLRAFTLLD